MTSAALSLLLTIAPVRLVHSVAGIPVGIISFEVRDGAAHYSAQHVFRGKERRFERSWPVDGEGHDADGLVAELQAFTSRRSGCRDVREERTGKRERLCLDDDGTGTLEGVAFRASYDEQGLSSIELVERGATLSRFDRQGGAPTFADPFRDGFPVSGAGATFGLEPSASIRVVRVEGVAAPRREGNCLEAARALAARSSAVVQLGPVVEDGRAWPHAWVRTSSGTFLDPTVGTGEVPHRHYLAFDEDPGRLYLELAAGVRKVKRSKR